MTRPSLHPGNRRVETVGGRIRLGTPRLHELIGIPPATRPGQFASLRARVTTVQWRKP